MARRQGKPGDYLLTDDYYGYTVYASRAQKDYWGNLTTRPLIRNLQEIATPLNDPYPVKIYRGPEYEQTTACEFEVTPQYIGTTNIPFPQTSAYGQAYNLNPGIGAATVGCTFVVA